MHPKQRRLPESSKAYEDGKHRRYSLLFAANCGAFAIAQLLTAKGTATVLGDCRFGICPSA